MLQNKSFKDTAYVLSLLSQSALSLTAMNMLALVYICNHPCIFDWHFSL